jgi:hypothetical protein
LISSTTGAATGSSVSACGSDAGTREVSEVRDRATEARAEATAMRVFARALSR